MDHIGLKLGQHPPKLPDSRWIAHSEQSPQRRHRPETSIIGQVVSRRRPGRAGEKPGVVSSMSQAITQ
jgi:hypothetical protein